MRITKTAIYKVAIYISTFFVAGFIDNLVNGRTFATLNFNDFQIFPISISFILYEAVFVVSGFLIIYSLRKKYIDLLTLPLWLVCFDVVSLFLSGNAIFSQMNWRKQIWGNPVGFVGELWLFNIPIGYWISIVFLGVYFIVLMRTEKFKIKFW